MSETASATTLQTADGTGIHFEWVPGADPVVLIHGMATTAELTWGVSGAIRALTEAGHGVLSYDMRGHGTSGKPRDAAAYSPEIMASDLLALMDHLELDTVHVVGFSLGSRVAWRFALAHPERVRRLVLGGLGTSDMLKEWSVDAVADLLRDGTPMADEMVTNLLTGALSLPGADSEALLAMVTGMAAGASEEAAVMPMPTMVIAGEADHIAVGADVVAEQLGAQFVSIPKRTHTNMISSRSYKQALTEFLA